jgi:hypothetical protein
MKKILLASLALFMIACSKKDETPPATDTTVVIQQNVPAPSSPAPVTTAPQTPQEKKDALDKVNDELDKANKTVDKTGTAIDKADRLRKKTDSILNRH